MLWNNSTNDSLLRITIHESIDNSARYVVRAAYITYSPYHFHLSYAYFHSINDKRYFQFITILLRIYRRHKAIFVFATSEYIFFEIGLSRIYETKRGKEGKAEFVIMRYSRIEGAAIEGFVDDRPRKMNSRARNAISRSGEIYLARGGDRVARGTRGISSIT